MPQLLQINYKFTVSREEFERGFDAIAAEIAKLQGCAGKSGWSMRLSRAAEAFTCLTTTNPFVPTSTVRSWQLKLYPILTDLSVKVFWLEGPTAVTRGPIEESATA
jgi:hypothetical protein